AEGALRTANRGQISCGAGSVGFGLGMVALGLMAVSSIRQFGLRGRQLGLILLAAALGAVATGLGRRALAWHAQVLQYRAAMPPAPNGAVTNSGVRARVDAAILLDCSGSMDFEENGHTRFSVAQVAGKQVLAGLHRGDRAALVLMGARQPEGETAPTADLQSVADRIDAARVDHDPADIRQGLHDAFTALDREGSSARDFYIVTDRQARNWTGMDSVFANRWNESAEKSHATTRIFVVPVGNGDADNVALESVELLDGPAILGQGANLNVEIKNFGTTARAALPVSVSVNHKVEFETTVSVPAGGTVRVIAPIKGGAFTAAGPQVVGADIRSTGYRADDHADGVIEVIEPIRVLIVSGEDWGTELKQFRNESDFLKLALSPFKTMGREGRDPCAVEVVSEDKLGEMELSSYKVLVLANVERLSEVQARAVEQYVYGGGGLLVAPGSLVRVENYNEQLWREGAGILPAELEDATGADGAQATSIVGYDSSTAVFQFLHQRPDLMLFPTIGRYFPTTPRSAEARALAWYTSGAPFLLESAGGKGRVLLVTTSLDADWSTLPLSSFYLPFVQSAVRYLAAGTMPSHNLSTGEAIRVTVDEAISEPATLDLPDGRQRSINGAQYGGTTEYQYDNTHEPGIYRLTVKDRTGELKFDFAIRTGREESDLTQLTEGQWAALEKDVRVRRIDPSDRPISTVVAGDREGVDLGPWVLLGALALGLGEVALVRAWSRESE
ncbi:MAG TPA: VWA domain-containing protein, partial [Tepidisphaeraceae bacterium]